ncbi:MAG: hypothetical protein HYU48_02480 [Candidatus Levybacteria bacterium]|nr:hypothetical protein [Candidatus Levybacteria bacterium]
MAQVSKRYISEKVEERILDLFWTSLSMLSTKQEISLLLDDLLSPTEKLMLSKRLAIAFMLIKGYNYPSINNKLKVSDPTIWNVKMAFQYKGKGYKTAIDKIIKREKMKKFWEDLDKLFEQVIPPRPGTNWTEVRRKQWEKRRKMQKPF